jgi:hypothetical protein
VEEVFDEVVLSRLDVTSERAIWEVQGSVGEYNIRFKEVFIQAGRMYSYYVIKEEEVVVGFDNYPDRRVLREKYGRDFQTHLSELVAHKHGSRKESLELTGEMTVEMFLNYLYEQNYLRAK